MNTIDIYRSASVILSPSIDQGTSLQKTLNGDEFINVVFSHDSFVEVLIGDYITFRGHTYTVRQAPDFNKVSDVHYEYSIRFDGPHYQLLDAMYLIDGDMEFYLTGTAEDFIDLIAENMNRVFGAGEYLTGSVTSTDFKVLHFSGENCLQVLQRVCQEFELEYYFSGDPVSINLTATIGSSTGLEYEYKSGLYNIKRTKVNNSNIITRLYPYGSEKNLGPDYTDRRTRTPLGSKLRLKYATYPDNYIEQNTGTYGVKEATKEFPDIYPHFVGAVDSTSDSQHIIDASIDFDLNTYLIEGVAAKIVFVNGDLSGYEFEIISFNNTTKEVYFKTHTDEQGVIWPSGSFIPTIGDQFTFVDIKMPPAYITAAEDELLSEATAYLSQISSPSPVYEIEMDWHALKSAAVSLDIGDVITITDSELAPGGTDVRIVDFTQNITNVYKYTVKLSDRILINYFKKIENERNSLERDVVLKRDGSLQRTRRGYQITADLSDTIFEEDGFLDNEKIRPGSIDPGKVSELLKGQQLIMNNVEFQVAPGGDTTKVNNTPGTLTHLTVESAEKTWTVSSGIHTALASSPLYIYVRASKATTSSQVIFSSTRYLINPAGLYYYFMIGILNEVVSGERTISLTHGASTITGRQIITGKLASADGETFLDLNTGEVQGKLSAKAGSLGYSNLSDKPTALADINTTEGGKLTSVEAGATAGADFNVNVANKPTQLRDLNTSEGDKLTGVQAGATVGADFNSNVTNKPTNLAGINSAEGTKLSGIAAEADKTETVIAGGLITSGRIELGGSTTVKAGINGAGTSDAEVRIWAGATYANRAEAPFRVLQDGTLKATNGHFSTAGSNARIDIKDTTLTMHLGSIGDNPYLKIDSDTERWGSEIWMRDTGLDYKEAIYTAGGVMAARNSEGILSKWIMTWDSGIVTAKNLNVSDNLEAQSGIFSFQGTNPGSSSNRWQKILSFDYTAYTANAFTLKVVFSGLNPINHVIADVHFGYKNQNGTHQTHARIVNYGVNNLLYTQFSVRLDETNERIILYAQIVSAYMVPDYTIIGSKNVNPTWYGTILSSLSGEPDDTWDSYFVDDYKGYVTL